MKETKKLTFMELRNMPLHQTVTLDGLWITKVPNGWLYTQKIIEVGESEELEAVTTCYVPELDQYEFLINAIKDIANTIQKLIDKKD